MEPQEPHSPQPPEPPEAPEELGGPRGAGAPGAPGATEGTGAPWGTGDPHAQGAAAGEAEAEPAESRETQFPCDNCGARMTWEPEVDALHCEYCDNRVQVERGEDTIVERPLEEAGDAARGLGVEARVSKCDTCGARVTYQDASTAEVCVYCGSANVLTQAANRNALRPESLVPLDVSRREVQESFRSWVKKLWFRPSALKKTKRIESMGVYVPFWTFDADVHSEWSADAGHYYYVTQTYTVRVNGRMQTRTRQVRKIRWEPAWGQRDDSYDDVLVHASIGVPHKLIGKLGGFDTTELVPYKPDYLAGWRAEEYQIDLEQGWAVGLEKIETSQRNLCAGDVPGDTYRDLRVRNRVSDVRWKHVLLPIWSVQYEFRSKTYTVLVNGQTGRLVGEAPYSWIKIMSLVLFLSFAAATVFVVSKASG